MLFEASDHEIVAVVPVTNEDANPVGKTTAQGGMGKMLTI